MKPINRLTINDVEMCKYCVVSTQPCIIGAAPPDKFYCGYQKCSSAIYIQQSEDMPCTTEDWANCPHNKPEPVYEWQWLLKRPTGKYDVTNNYYTCHYEMQKANGLSSDFWRIEGSKRERTA